MVLGPGHERLYWYDCWNPALDWGYCITHWPVVIHIFHSDLGKYCKRPAILRKDATESKTYCSSGKKKKKQNIEVVRGEGKSYMQPPLRGKERRKA